MPPCKRRSKTSLAFEIRDFCHFRNSDSRVNLKLNPFSEALVLSKKLLASLSSLGRWRFLPALMVCIATGLSLPALNNGIICDDYFHISKYLNRDRHVSDATIFGMFSFTDDGSDKNTPGKMHHWWQQNIEVNTAFWRPITELSHLIDYELWMDSPPLMHLHSLVLYALIIYLVTQSYFTFAKESNHPLYREIAVIAALLYALSGLYGTAIGWLANRNELLAVLFSLLCLLLHHQWRSKDSRLAAAAAVLTLILGLFSKESAIAICAYLFAYSLYLDKHPPKQRLASLLPYIIVTILWKLTYDGLGFGQTYAAVSAEDIDFSNNYGRYINPSLEPLAFINAYLERSPILLFSQFFGVPAGGYNMLESSMQQGYWLLAVSTLSALALVFIPNIFQHRLTKFYLSGMALALVPACVAPPDERLLMFIGFSAYGILGMIFVHWFIQSPLETSKFMGRLRSPFIIVLLVSHILFAPGYHLVNVFGTKFFCEPFTKDAALALDRIDRLSEKQIVLLNPPITFLDGFIPLIRSVHGLELAKRFQVLAEGSSPITLTAVSKHRITIEMEGGFTMLKANVGDRFETPGLAAEVLTITKDRAPLVMAFDFSEGIYSDELQFLAWVGDNYQPLPLPKLHMPIRIEATNIQEIMSSFARRHFENTIRRLQTLFD